MSEIKFTDEQLAIIGGEVSDVLVSAAAGSGKTTVLVERIIRQIVAGTLSIDRLLVVTFTNDAANHMAEKIEKVLNERIKAAQASGDTELVTRLSEQLNLIPNSYIQTIDSFCSRVLKEKGHLINTPEERDVFASGNVILDESNLSLILNRAANLAVMDMYASNQGEDTPFIKLTNRFGNGRTDDALVSAIVDAFKKLRSIPDYCNRIDECINRRIECKNSDKNEYIEYVVNDFARTFEKVLPLIDDLEEYCSATGRYPVKGSSGKKVNGMTREEAAGVVYSYFRQYVNGVLAVVNDDSNDLRTKYEAIRDITPIKDLLNEGILGGVNSIKDDPDLQELAKKISPSIGNIMTPFKKVLPSRSIPSNYSNFLGAYKLPDNYQDLLCYSYDEHMKSMNDNTDSIIVFGELLKLCDKYYAELKAALHGSDFADQEYGAYEVLKTQDASEFYRDKFQEIYIDEYQDNSELQDAIICCFARREGNGNVFRVGDVKQSIYKFRSADPEMFIKHLNKLSATPPEEPGVLRLLKENHRSSRQILDFVNFVFGQIMTAEASEIEYDDKQTLKAAQETPDSAVPKIVVVNRASEFWDTYSEGQLASEEESSDDDSEEENFRGSAEDRAALNERLQQSLCLGVLHEVNEYLHSSEDHEEKDICVLTKTVSKSKMISQFLKEHGINAASENRTKIFEDMDIQCVINLIILLGNEYRDEYLMSVMLKNLRFTNFTLDDLAEINAFFMLNDDLKDYLRLNLMVRIRKFCEVNKESELQGRLVAFLDAFDDLRMTSRAGDIDDLVDMIYTKSGIMANIRSTDKLGANKLILLKDWLTGNFKRYGTDISTIAARLEEMKIKINTDARFDAKDASDAAVHCMSIHKSKGLEYPFVILAFDDGKENGDSAGNVLFDKQEGFISKDYDDELICIKKSAERAVFDNKNALAENAEALRLLYVALTRAEKYLSIVTAADVGTENKVSFINSACDNAAAASDYTFGSSHWLSGTKKIGYALMSSVMRASCASSLRTALGRDEASFERIIDYEGFEVQILDEDELQKTLDQRGRTADSSNSEAGTNNTSYDAYDHEKSITIPFKVAVTGINDWNVSSTTHVDMRVKDKEEYMDHLAGRVTSAGQGSIVHLIMQWGDMERYASDKDALISNVKELIDDGIFSQYKPEDVLKVADRFADGIISFAASDLGKRMNQADIKGDAEYEKPIVFAVPAYEGAEKQDFVLVQGIIDAIFYEDDGAVIVDYKTDNFGDIKEDELITQAKSRHKFQVECYSASCEASGIHVKERYLYLVRYGLMVPL